jgi:hypothetical protein
MKLHHKHVKLWLTIAMPTPKKPYKTLPEDQHSINGFLKRMPRYPSMQAINMQLRIDDDDGSIKTAPTPLNRRRRIQVDDDEEEEPSQTTIRQPPAIGAAFVMPITISDTDNEDDGAGKQPATTTQTQRKQSLRRNDRSYQQVGNQPLKIIRITAELV